MAFNILLPDQEGYSKSVGTGKSYRWWVFSSHIISLSKRLPNRREHSGWGTNQQEWLDSKMGWWGRLFFDSCHNPAMHRPFLLKNNRARESKKDSLFNWKCTEHLLHPRNWSGCWGFSGEQKRRTPCPHGASYYETDKKKKKTHTQRECQAVLSAVGEKGWGKEEWEGRVLRC